MQSLFAGGNLAQKIEKQEELFEEEVHLFTIHYFYRCTTKARKYHVKR